MSTVVPLQIVKPAQGETMYQGPMVFFASPAILWRNHLALGSLDPMSYVSSVSYDGNTARQRADWVVSPSTNGPVSGGALRAQYCAIFAPLLTMALYVSFPRPNQV